MKERGILVFVFFFLVISLCLYGSVIKGTVIDLQTKTPLDGAVIQIEGTQIKVLTDDGGRFEIKGLQPGNYNLLISKKGYYRKAVEVVLKPGKEVTLEIELVRKTSFNEEILVVAKPYIPYPEIDFSHQELSTQSIKDIGEFFREVPGGSAIKKGGTALDPSFRGFQKEQLAILLNDVIRVEGACPNRMDPPTSHFHTDSLERLEIYKGPFTVRYGAVFGGLVNLKMKEYYHGTEKFRLKGEVNLGYETNGAGKNLSMMLDGGNRKYNLKFAGTYRSYDNYKTGDNREISSSFNRYDYSLDFGLRPTESQSLKFSYHHAYSWDVMYPALPMDAVYDSTNVFSLSYRWLEPFEKARQFNFRLYYSKVDHEMDNSNKPSYMMLSAVTTVKTFSFGGRVELELDLAEGTLFVGGDFYRNGKDGIRVRDIKSGPMAGAHFEDIIWPDAVFEDAGVFTEYHRSLSDRTFLSAGLRVDHVRTWANNPENSFVSIFGADLEKRDFNYNLALNLTYSLSQKSEIVLSAGKGTRSPSIAERYLYLLPVGLDRYDYLGNPDLRPEHNYQIELGYRLMSESFLLKASVFYSYLTDYISAAVTEEIAPRSPMVIGVKKFVNIEKAYKYGGELITGVKLSRHLIFEGALSYTYGYDLTNEDYLPEIPPLETNLRVRYESTLFWGEVHTRIVAKQTKVSRIFAEMETDGFTLINMNFGFNLKFARLIVEIRNLTNELYYEHLSRKILMTMERIPEPGRSIYIAIQKSF